MNKKFKYTTAFKSTIKCIVDKEKDRFLACASIESLKDLITDDVRSLASIDLLPVSFNLFVVNRANANGDIINTEGALEIYQQFAHRPLNIEHDRNEVVGHSISAHFTEFGSNNPLKLEDIKDTEEPFNVALVGFVYRIVNEDFAEKVEEASDPNSLKYESISASWEIGFDDIKIFKGSKNYSEGTLIEDAEEIERLLPQLQLMGGNGIDKKDGEPIYNLVSGEKFPLGSGFTLNPAAEVKGVATANKKENKSTDSTEKTKKVSQTKASDVKASDMKNVSSLNDVLDLRDDDLKEVSASQLGRVITKEIEKINEDWKSKSETQKTEISEAKDKAEKAENDLAEANTKLDNMQEQLDQIKAAQEEKEAEDLFNSRMTAIDEKYELDDKVRKVVAKEIKDLDEENFNDWLESFEVLAEDKLKSNEPEEGEEPEGDDTTLDNALNKAKANKNQARPPVTTKANQSIREQFKDSFGTPTLKKVGRKAVVAI